MPKKRKSQPNTNAVSTASTKPRKPRKQKQSSALAKLSPAGLSYFKCNTCPFDFVSTDFQGIPDEYSGRTISKKHQFVASAGSFTTGNDYYYLFLPIPGVCCFTGSRTTNTYGAMTLNMVPYQDNATLFPPAAESQNVTGFRHASNVAEFINTTNDMVWGGSIQVTKGFVELTANQDKVDSGTYWGLNGLSSLCNQTRPDIVFPSKEGCFVTAGPINPAQDFTPVMNNQTYAYLTQSSLLPTGENITLATFGSNNFIGISKMEAIVVKIVNPPTGTSMILRTEACVEYQVNPSSLLYEYAHSSPGYDPTALAMVSAFRKSHPVAVMYKDNARFWDSVLEWARKITSALKILPGPAGAVSSGVNTILEAF